MERQDLLSFLESDVFTRAWKKCGLSDDSLFDLQMAIALHPRAHPVIEGTGGVRKIRFSPRGRGRGQSGSHRACYVFFEAFGLVLLLTAYPKNKRDNISAAGRTAMRRMVEYQTKLLSKGPLR